MKYGTRRNNFITKMKRSNYDDMTFYLVIKTNDLIKVTNDTDYFNHRHDKNNTYPAERFFNR